jgi:hypothetical protein
LHIPSVAMRYGDARAQRRAPEGLLSTPDGGSVGGSSLSLTRGTHSRPACCWGKRGRHLGSCRMGGTTGIPRSTMRRPSSTSARSPRVGCQPAESVVGDVAWVVADRAGPRVGEDDRGLRDPQDVACRGGRHVGQVDQPPEPVHLLHDLPPDDAQPTGHGDVGSEAILPREKAASTSSHRARRRHR